MQKYEEPLTLGPSWFEMIFGLSNRTKEINEEIIRERQIQHYNIVRDQMRSLCGELKKDLGEAYQLKKTKLSSLKILDSDRNTARSEDLTKIIIEYDIFVSSVNGKCEMIYETVEELRKLIPKKDLSKIEVTITSFEEFAEDIQMKLGKMKEELTDLLEKSLIEEDKIMKKRKKENEESDARFEEIRKRIKEGKATFGDFKQQNYAKLRPEPGSSYSASPDPDPKPGSNSGPELIPNKYFRDTVKHYTKKTMTSPVADKKEIDKMYKKLSLHIHAGSAKYNKLSLAEQKEADEIFKKIKAEKEKYVPKSGKSKKKTKKKKPKRTRKVKKKS